MPSATASQTIGPFWHLIEHPEWADLTRFGAAGPQVSLTGSVIDGDGNPVTDAAVELWQSDPPADDHFPGFGRSRTDEAGRFHFKTVKPGPVPGRGNARQALVDALLEPVAQAVVSKLHGDVQPAFLGPEGMGRQQVGVV